MVRGGTKTCASVRYLILMSSTHGRVSDSSSRRQKEFLVGPDIPTWGVLPHSLI